MDTNYETQSDPNAVTYAVAAELRRMAGAFRTFDGFFYKHPCIDPAAMFPAGDPNVADLIEPGAYETTMADLEAVRETAARTRRDDFFKHCNIEAAIHDADASYFADACLLRDLERDAVAKLNNDNGEAR